MDGFRVSGIGPAKRGARATSGYVDPSTVTGRPWPGYRKADFGTKTRRPRRGNGPVVEKRDPARTQAEWAELHTAWLKAEPGQAKRDALSALNIFEKRHGLARERVRVEVEVVNAAGAVASATGDID